MPPRIDRGLCVGCGICLFQCGQGVFSFDAEAEKSKVAQPRRCVDCFICEKYCPVRAIQVKVGKPK
ncbi:MAG: 4Fe-4S dicluster domain-containing protein [Anaerolineae bacterium]